MKKKNKNMRAFPVFFSLIRLACLLLLSLNLIAAQISSSRPKLARVEVEALKVIGQKLGKKDWNFKFDPCSGEANWNLTCDCSFNNNRTCHVVSILLKAENLPGQLPPEFNKLRFLRILDLSRNVLTGSVPSQWAKMRLVELSLMGNQLSGPFPKPLTHVTTLQNVTIEANQFSGTIPPELGNLINLQKMILSSNKFTGQLPVELAKLTNLSDLRLSDNNFSGKIPDFIRNWTKIEKLHIQGSSLQGPIPRAVSELTTLRDLRISDLTGSASEFPQLNKMKSMRTLILRKCLLQGNVPHYIGEMESLKNLDLSFNNLTGVVPESFAKLDRVDFMYLTGNMLTGAIPDWILKRNKNVDVSYNNFTWDSSAPSQCSSGGSVNILGSYSSAVNTIRQVPACMKRDFPCAHNPVHHSLHINCGGGELILDGGTKYEADEEQRSASTLYLGKDWALSSTGNFMDNDKDADSYLLSNISSISNISGPSVELYKTARASPLSLTYYGLCLMKGDYTVTLHFAEIVFQNGNSFENLGRRIFDVYIQEKLVLKDFNIEDEAGGPSKALVKTFKTLVEKGTLVIHFYWAGKGTQGMPNRGVYGPLISAISIKPNFKAPFDHKKISIILLVGVSASICFLIILILHFLWKKGWLGGKVSIDKDFKSLDAQMGSFSLRQIKAATKNFDVKNKIGEGGFGSVYKGLLSDGTVVAVKQLSSKSKQGSREFVNEVGMISALQHPNLVKLHGCCVEGNQLLLVYEYMENNCLSRALFARDIAQRLKLDWQTRQKICLGIARGLAYLHEESVIKIVHRDIKASNVLLDKDLNAKISDFGLAKVNEEDDTHISTRIAGTIGYMAPEYAMRGYLTPKADVYSFGVVALEIVSGKSNTNHRPMEECVYLLDWAYVLQERGSLLELVDPDLGSEFCTEAVMVMLNVALLCTNASPTLRPTMTEVVSMLEGRIAVQDLSDPGFSTLNPRVKAIRNHFWQTQSQTGSMSSTNGSYTDRSNADRDDTGHLLGI